ncbi:MAG: hypothetical protein D6694_09630, partial [Gammaproteobacteria bacterium]
GFVPTVLMINDDDEQSSGGGNNNNTGNTGGSSGGGGGAACWLTLLALAGRYRQHFVRQSKSGRVKSICRSAVSYFVFLCESKVSKAASGI